MKKKIKKHTISMHILTIVFITLLVVLFIMAHNRVFGANYDWDNQTLPFYEYFRNLFYQTGKIFPNFAPHIGAGQNIYYFVYYGLYSPLLFISYLFPFVRSGDYIMTINILTSMCSVILFYFFLIQNGYSKKMSLLVSLMFLFNGTLLVRNFMHIMMVQYMPFLILALMGTKKMLDEGKSILLVVSVILIITTSYYFSIPSIICLCTYALYYYLKINKKIKFKNLVNAILKYVSRIMIGIVISAFLLLPVIFTLFNGRNTIKAVIDISSFIPTVNSYFILYISFGLGMTAIIFVTLFYNLLYLKKENKIMTIILFVILTIPAFNLLLNGMLYESGKVFIPLLPLFYILMIEMFNSVKNIKLIKLIIVFVISFLFILLFVRIEYLKLLYFFCFDFIITMILLILFNKKKKILCLVPLLSICFIMLLRNLNDARLMSFDNYNDIYDRMDMDTSGYLNVNTNSIYRYQDNMYSETLNYSDAVSQYKTSVYSSASNWLYNDLFYNTFNNNYNNYTLFYLDQYKNLFFLKFMGVRYLTVYDEEPYGYFPVLGYSNEKLLENKNVYSIGFASSNLLSYDDYNKLSFIEKLEAFLYNIIIDGESSNSDLQFNYEKIDPSFEIIDTTPGIKLQYNDDYYIVNSYYYDGVITLKLKKELRNKALVIRININNSSTYENAYININGVNDALGAASDIYYNNNKTFDYVISSNDVIDELYFKFSKGIHDLSDIEIYAIDNSFFDKNNTTPINIDFDKTKGDDIYGSIDVKESGYFIFTIPYDKGFTIYVDNKKVNIEQVNNGFIGFKIDKGNHDIHLTFEAPFAKLGRIISLFGIFMLIILCVFERKKSKI